MPLGRIPGIWGAPRLLGARVAGAGGELGAPAGAGVCSAGAALFLGSLGASRRGSTGRAGGALGTVDAAG